MMESIRVANHRILIKIDELRNLETILELDELDELGHLEKVAQLQWHVLVMHLPTRWLEDHQPARTW